MRILNGAFSGALWSAATRLAEPGLRVWLGRRLARGAERPGRLAERRGIDPTPRPEGRLAWLHAASVGETLSVLPLLAALGRVEPDLNFLVTTASVTAADLFRERLPGLGLGMRARHRFVPLDVPSWARRFLTHWRPNVAIFVESELWPNLIATAKARGIPLALVNARLSARSARRWRWARGLARRTLGSFALIAARSEADAERLSGLGAPRVQALGDLKDAAPPLPVDEAEQDRLAKLLGERPRWLAASTHPGEDAIAAGVHRRLIARYPNLLTIIAPRHPDEGPAIAAGLGAIPCTRRARGEDPPPNGVWIADTLGELGLLYRLAPIVFVGKSLAGHGGQNPIEPARLGAAIAVGPHTENFTEAVAALVRAGGLVEVADAAALESWVGDMLGAPERARKAGAAARSACSNSAELPRQLAEQILELLARERSA